MSSFCSTITPITIPDYIVLYDSRVLDLRVQGLLLRSLLCFLPCFLLCFAVCFPIFFSVFCCVVCCLFAAVSYAV